VSLLVLGLQVLVARADAQDSANKKTLKRIMQGIELIPSLYAPDEVAGKVNTFPKFSAKRLAEYGVDKKGSVDLERERWQANREQYAKGYPLRAAIFEAAIVMKSLQGLKAPLTLQAAELPKVLFQNGRVIYPLDFEYWPIGGTPYLLSMNFRTKASKEKAEALVALLEKQAPASEAIFKLEKVLQQMRAAAAERDNEKSKRWQADFDFALARVEANFIFLYEYNHTMGQIRVDALPDLGPGEVGWKISFQPQITVTEQKPRNGARERQRLLRRLQEIHAETPWAYFAERESRRDLGMTWTAKKKP
jgi:hypothetical protein